MWLYRNVHLWLFFVGLLETRQVRLRRSNILKKSLKFPVATTEATTVRRTGVQGFPGGNADGL